MKGSSRAVVLAWLVFAPLMLGQQAQAWAWGMPWGWDWPRLQQPDRFPRQFKPVLYCVEHLSLHASEYYAFAKRRKEPSKKACRSLLHLSTFCQHRLQYFLNLSLDHTKKLKHVCHKRLKGKSLISPSPSPLPPASD